MAEKEPRAAVGETKKCYGSWNGEGVKGKRGASGKFRVEVGRGGEQ